MNNFDLKKFLIENKLTQNSKLLNEVDKPSTGRQTTIFSDDAYNFELVVVKELGPGKTQLHVPLSADDDMYPDFDMTVDRPYDEVLQTMEQLGASFDEAGEGFVSPAAREKIFKDLGLQAALDKHMDSYDY